MKKRIAMLLCAVVLAMTACGSEDAQGNADEVSTVESSTPVESSATAESTVESTATENMEASKEAEATEEEIVYAFGEYTDTGYDAEWLGYRFTTPEGCTLATPEELISLLGMSVDTISSDYSDGMVEYAKQKIVYDLYASYEASATNVNVCVQNVSTSFFTLEQLVESSIKQLENMTSMKTTVHEGREKVEIAGREYIKFDSDVVVNDVAMKQSTYVTIVPDYVITVTTSYFEGNEAEAEALIAAFSEL